MDIKEKMLIDLTQHATRCSDSSGQAQEYLIARHAAVETETVLVQICLELGAPSVICSLKECFQITDCLVYPMQIICFVFLCVQFHTFQIQVASVTVAFYLRFGTKYWSMISCKVFPCTLSTTFILANSGALFAVLDTATTILALSVPRPRLPLWEGPPT